MEVEIRRVPEEHFELFGQTIAACFGSELPADMLSRIRRVVDISRNLGAYDGETLVGTAEALAHRLTVPGGEVAAAGVTSVGVLPTHRRRGILTRLMRKQLEDVHGWGEPVAMLWSSEAGIYPRFGYGLATKNGRVDAERDRMTLATPGEPTGHIRLLGRDEALAVLPGIYDQVRAETPGFFARSADWWDAHTLSDLPFDRGSDGPLFQAVLELDGHPAAYVLYRVEGGSSLGVSERRLRVKEEISTSPLATREIWRFLFGMDLIPRVQAPRLAADHPLFLLVSEPPRLHLSIGDGLFVRLVDVRAALEARSYAGDGA